LKLPERLPSPEDLKEIVIFIKKHRRLTRRFDVVDIRWLTGLNCRKDAGKVRPLAESGMTRWLDGLYTRRDSPERMRSRNRHGPLRGIAE